MTTPLVAIIDWAQSLLGEPTSSIEKAVIGETARVERFLCNGDEDFTDEILDAKALIVWHNTPITAPGIVRLRDCRGG